MNDNQQWSYRTAADTRKAIIDRSERAHAYLAEFYERAIALAKKMGIDGTSFDLNTHRLLKEGGKRSYQINREYVNAQENLGSMRPAAKLEKKDLESARDVAAHDLIVLRHTMAQDADALHKLEIHPLAQETDNANEIEHLTSLWRMAQSAIESGIKEADNLGIENPLRFL